MVGIVKGVDRGQRLGDDVGDRDREQPVAALFAQFEEAAVVPRANQELVEFVGAVVVHAAAGMPAGQVFPVQREVLVAADRRHDACIDVGIARQATALAAIRPECPDRDAHGHAGVATAAARPIDDVAGAAEAPVQRQRIGLRQARVARVEDQVAGLAPLPVAAGMGARVEHAQVVGLGSHADRIAPAFSGAQAALSTNDGGRRFPCTPGECR